jgi:hypothetical protein
MENKMQDLEKILTKFEEIVSIDFCESLAKKTKLVQRSTSNLKGHEFAQVLMLPHASLEAESLNNLAARMRTINNSCDITASALAQRINTEFAVSFMKSCFGKLLNEIMKEELNPLFDLQNLSGFNRILIEDSTKFELHEKLGEHFKGCGGSASKSSVKIDYIFNYLTEEFVDIAFFSGSVPDQSLSGRIISLLEADDLVIRDLGYYALGKIKEIEEKKAYYISRHKSDIVVYESKGAAEPLDLAQFLDKKIFQGIIDVEIFIGKEKHPVRLVACLMDEQAVNKRNRAANKSAKRTGVKTSKKKLSLLKYCIFITNIPSIILSAISIIATYRSRWRVELIFKQWKTCLKLHVFKGYNKERFHCMFYGRLIMILLMGAICPPLMLYAQKWKKELSCFKLCNYLIADNLLVRAFAKGRVSQFIDQLIADLPKRLCMDKRNRPSLRSNVRKGNSYYNQQETNWLKENVA